MRSAVINKQTIYYALYTGITDATDSDGFLTGEKVKTYADPVEFRINVSPSKGYAKVEPFGIETSYDRVMNTCDLTCPINEETLVWVGRTPSSGPHNYRVTRVAPGLMNIVYGLEAVCVSGSEVPPTPPTPPTPTPTPPTPDPDDEEDNPNP